MHRRASASRWPQGPRLEETRDPLLVGLPAKHQVSSLAMRRGLMEESAQLSRTEASSRRPNRPAAQAPRRGHGLSEDFSRKTLGRILSDNSLGKLSKKTSPPQPRVPARCHVVRGSSKRSPPAHSQTNLPAWERQGHMEVSLPSSPYLPELL